MSIWFDRADALATRIEGLFTNPDEVAVVVDRQKDIVSEFNKRIGKVKGGVVIIEWSGATNVSPDLDALRVTSRYAITVITKPIIRDQSDKLPIDDLLETITNGIHLWNPDQAHCMDEMRVISIEPVPNQQFRIFVIRVEQEQENG